MSGAGLAGMGMVVAVGRRAWAHGLVLGRRIFVVSLEVPKYIRAVVVVTRIIC